MTMMVGQQQWMIVPAIMVFQSMTVRVVMTWTEMDGPIMVALGLMVIILSAIGNNHAIPMAILEAITMGQIVVIPPTPQQDGLRVVNPIYSPITLTNGRIQMLMGLAIIPLDT